MKEVVGVYTKDTAFQVLSAMFPLTVSYDVETSKYYVKYENCNIHKEGKLIVYRGSGETISNVCFNYLAIINFGILSLKAGNDTYKLMFMKAQ